MSPIEAGQPILGYTDDAEWIKDIEFVKLREISLSYAIPSNLMPRAFLGKQASLAVEAGILTRGRRIKVSIERTLRRTRMQPSLARSSSRTNSHSYSSLWSSST